MANTSDNIYYSFVVSNSTSDFVPAHFYEYRNVALVDRQEDYKLEIIKFTAPTTSIPILIYSGGTPETTNNLGTVSFLYAGDRVPYTATVQLTNLNEPAGAPQTINNNTPGILYSVYQYDQFLAAINYALQNAATLLNTAHPGAIVDVPYFQFNSVTQNFTLVGSTTFDPLGGSFNNVTMYSNNFIWRLFYGFPIFFNNITPNPNLLVNYQFFNLHNNEFLTGFYTMQQDFSSVPYWFFLKKVFLTTNKILINSENIGVVGGNGVPLLQNILSEYNFNFTSTIQYYTPINYVQIGEKDRIDLLGTGPLNNIEISAYYQDIYGNTYPILIQENESFEVKVKFIKFKNFQK